jgi:NAD(P)-dependent dehydrogenase (short-subunit alcohol dehydrogenase family)
MKRFENKIVMVTGAASGIGRACVERFVAEGALVIAIDQNEEGLKETISALGATDSVYMICSVNDEEQVKHLYQTILGRYFRIDVLVNMAGILRASYTTDTSLTDFMQLINVNLVSTFLMCKHALPHLLKTKGSIVNAASTSASFGHPYMAAYSASKGAIAAFTKSVAWEYLKTGVRINAVAPGGINTPMTAVDPLASLRNHYDPSLFIHLSRPDAVMGDPASVAGLIAMLASNDASFMTGEIVKIDGGNHN